MTHIEFSLEISRAILAIVQCEHPREKVAGDTCTLCGAVYLRDSGWAKPVRVVALQTALDGGQKIQKQRA